MLDKSIDEIVYENGQVVGVKSQGEVSQYMYLCRRAVYSLHMHVTSVHVFSELSLLFREQKAFINSKA